MNRDEFILWAVIYALVVSAGFSGPVLKRLESLPWDLPVNAFRQALFRTTPPGNKGPQPVVTASKKKSNSTNDRIGLEKRTLREPVLVREGNPSGQASDRVLSARPQESITASLVLDRTRTACKTERFVHGREFPAVEEPAKD